MVGAAAAAATYSTAPTDSDFHRYYADFDNRFAPGGGAKNLSAWPKGTPEMQIRVVLETAQRTSLHELEGGAAACVRVSHLAVGRASRRRVCAGADTVATGLLSPLDGRVKFLMAQPPWDSLFPPRKDGEIGLGSLDIVQGILWTISG